MRGSYNWYLVTLSLVVAMLASYTTLDLAARIRSIEAEGRRRFYWLLGGAMSMGTGIWSMHFIGMLAFRMPIELGYDVGICTEAENGSTGRKTPSATVDRWKISAHLDTGRGDAGSSPVAHPSA